MAPKPITNWTLMKMNRTVRRTTSLSHIKITEESDESNDCNRDVTYTQIITEQEADELYPKGLRKNSSALSLLSVSNMSS